MKWLLLIAAALACAGQVQRKGDVVDNTVANVANLPVRALGANDLIAVTVYDAPELSRTIRISADGFIRLPMLKQRIKADGLLPADVDAAIVKAVFPLMSVLMELRNGG